VSDVEAVVQAAVGGQAATQVIQGEKLFDLVVRMQPQFRSTPDQIGNLLVGAPDGEQIPLKELASIQENNGASLIIAKTIPVISECNTTSNTGTWNVPSAMGKKLSIKLCSFLKATG
jgi:Cu/Ag efflux pump CusA